MGLLYLSLKYLIHTSDNNFPRTVHTLRGSLTHRTPDVHQAINLNAAVFNADLTRNDFRLAAKVT